MKSGLTVGIVAAVSLSVVGANAEAPPFAANRRYDPGHSFRGLSQNNLSVDNYEVSGHASTVSGVHDYFRLVSSQPSSYGAIFSHQPVPYNEWVAEVAFRVHGHHFTGIDSESGRSFDKGGRGLAFWYTKSANPTDLTASNDPRKKLSPQPNVVPQFPVDPTDKDVSLFGYKTAFDGLGIIFDTMPQHPLVRRSSSENWENGRGSKQSGVVAGILDDDDGTSKWLDDEGREMDDSDEALYLEKAIGECEAAFRNADGLLWARISYVKGTIRVDLDLAPHTTLSPQGRDYAHNCFTLSGVKLEKGYYVGLTALAAGNPEPDTVDVYALDFFEVLPENQPAGVLDSAPEDQHTLAGTQEKESTTFAHEIFLSQARLIEAVDALARRVETAGPASARLPIAPLIDRLNTIENRLATLGASGTSGQTAADGTGGESYQQLAAANERLQHELRAATVKLDSMLSQLNGLTGQLTARAAESAKQFGQLLQSMEETQRRCARSTSKQGISPPSQYMFLGGFAVVTGFVLMLFRRRGSSWDREKKMI